MDLTLCEASHLDHEDLKKSPQQILAEIQRRQEIVADAIEAETKPGDLIMLEGPIERTPMEHLEPWLNRHPADRRPALVRHADFYADIAHFARSIGRRVESLDSGTNSMYGGSVSRAFVMSILGNAGDEGALAAELQRDRIMEKRIKAKNPRLAIAAGDHLRWLCHTTQPAKLINQEGNSYPFEQLKVVAHRNYMKKLGMMEKLNSLRKARRAPINTALKRRIT